MVTWLTGYGLSSFFPRPYLLLPALVTSLLRTATWEGQFNTAYIQQPAMSVDIRTRLGNCHTILYEKIPPVELSLPPTKLSGTSRMQRGDQGRNSRPGHGYSGLWSNSYGLHPASKGFYEKTSPSKKVPKGKRVTPRIKRLR